jgi:hypothetical protein
MTSGAWGTICLTAVDATSETIVLTTPSDGYTVL